MGVPRQASAMICLAAIAVSHLQIADAQEKFEITIAAQPIADAVKSLSYQTQHSVLFQTDVLGDAYAKPISGELSLQQALDLLLEGTSLQGGLTSSGVIVISQNTSANAPGSEGSILTNEKMKQALLAGAAAAAINGAPAIAQTETTPTPEAVDVVETDAEEEALINDTIVVTGRRLDQNLSIAAKRDAKQIVDTITADQSSRLPDNNIAESLGRIPGVSFLRDIDTGDGTFVSIRGLDSALNNIQFDGVNAGVASGGARRVGIDGLTSDDVSELRVLKSLLPEDEGEGIGGSVQIITKSALERGEDRFDVGLEGRRSDFHNKTGFSVNAAGTKIFNENFGVNLSATFRRREIRNFEIDSSSTNLAFLPTFTFPGGQTFTNADILANGNDDLLDAGTAFDNVPSGTFSTDVISFEDQTYGTQRQTRDTFALSGTVDWRITENTLLTLGGRYNDEDIEATENFLRIEDDDGDFEDVNGVLTTEFRDPEIDLSFEIEDRERIQSTLFLRGETTLDRWQLKYQASYSGAESSSPETILDFSTASLLDRDTVNPVPFTYVDTYFPVPDLSVLSDPEFVAALADPSTFQIAKDIDAQIFDRRKNDRYALRFDADYELDWQAFGGNFNTVSFGAKFERSELTDETIEFDEGAEFIDLDGTFDASENGSAEDATLGSFPGLFTGDAQSLSPIGSPLSGIGVNGIPIPDDGAFRALVSNFNRTIRSSTEFDDLVSRDSRDVSEDLYAAYAQTEFQAGRLTLTGGVRLEHYEAQYKNPATFDGSIDITNLINGAEENNEFDVFSNAVSEAFTQRSDNFEVLPRMNAIFEFSDTFQIRAGAGLSLARPTISQLSSPIEVDLGIELDRSNVGDTPILPGVDSAAAAVAAGGFGLADISDGSLTVESGNPDLENAVSQNFDLSFEWYPKSGTSLAVGLFHKRIENFIFIGAEPAGGAINLQGFESSLTPDGAALLQPLGGLQGLADAGVLDVEIVQPKNGDVGTIQGVEIGLNHQLDWAPGVFSDMGFSANVTFTESRATIPVASALDDDEALVILGIANEGDSLSRRTQFFNSPPVSGNVSLYYDANGLDIGLSGSYQDQSFNAVDDFGLDQYDDEYWRFDLSVAYELPTRRFGETVIYFEVPDFTDDGQKPTSVQTIGKTRRLFDLATFNGREVRFGLRTKF